MKYLVLLLLSSVVSIVALPSFHIGTLQSAAVKGQLLCNDKPAANVKVKLYDDDSDYFESDAKEKRKTEESDMKQ
ncbi:hypothetical protein AB6A40_006808 [Gnathostoma spinigerum]|uniref:Transthyretin-like family protein n=1 Tax=Gnathostoma spinigerum TaxID=75299 RepID=A0ABD6EJF9_9BILA